MPTLAKKLWLVGGDRRQREKIQGWVPNLRIVHWEQDDPSNAQRVPAGTTHVVIWAKHCSHPMSDCAVKAARTRGVPFSIARSNTEMKRSLQVYGLIPSQSEAVAEPQPEMPQIQPEPQDVQPQAVPAEPEHQPVKSLTAWLDDLLGPDYADGKKVAKTEAETAHALAAAEGYKATMETVWTIMRLIKRRQRGRYAMKPVEEAAMAPVAPEAPVKPEQNGSHPPVEPATGPVEKAQTGVSRESLRQTLQAFVDAYDDLVRENQRLRATLEEMGRLLRQTKTL